MNEITAILDKSRSNDDIISDLKEKSVEIPAWGKLIKQYEPSKHEIVTDTTSRKDKIRSDGVKEEASRLYIGLEKLLAKRVTEFTFAIPVKRVYHNVEDNETRKKISKATEAIYKYARIDSENIKRGNAYYASCEICTIWYAVEKKNTLYGFDSKYKLKCKTYSPMDGVKLYPLVDELDDMLAMSFEYRKKIGNNEVVFFETYTDDKHYKWRSLENGWVLEKEESIAILKIPGAYCHRMDPVYDGLSHIRKEIEYTLSRNSDVIAYNSAPILKLAGAVVGQEDKGETRRVYRVEGTGDVSYVSWSQSIEALKYHVETLLKMFFMLAQMPDISFENMKSLGSIGFDARQTILTDAHLKIGDESGVWVEFLERECNVIKAFLKMMNTGWASEIDNIEVEHIITPFIQNDEKAEIQKWSTACGGKAVASQLEAIKNLGISNNPQDTYDQIHKEEKQVAENNRIVDVFNTAE